MGTQSSVVLDTPGAAEFLGVSPRTLEGMRVRGNGPPFSKVGGRVVYRVAVLEEFLERQERVSTSDPGTPISSLTRRTSSRVVAMARK
jgi:hypothetical protein